MKKHRLSFHFRCKVKHKILFVNTPSEVTVGLHPNVFKQIFNKISCFLIKIKVKWCEIVTIVCKRLIFSIMLI